MPTPSLADYEIVGDIGSGSYGTCKKIRRKRDGKLLVWKEMNYGLMSETEKQMLVSEVNLLRELKHKHIVRYYDRIVDRTNSILYLIMEFCDGGDLSNVIATLRRESRSIDEQFVWKVGYQALLALNECHSRQKDGKAILHRDLKPANIFLDSDNNVKLGDFGLARVLNHETSFAQTFVGTPYYMSPEQMSYMSYNNKSDVWSLGCLLYELCALKPPFIASSQKELAQRICSGRFPRLPPKYSEDLNNFIIFMLVVDEAKRPTTSNLLQHPLILKRLSLLNPEASNKTLTADEGYESRGLSLKIKEDELLVKEKKLALKEKQILYREMELQRKEQKLEASIKDLESREKNLHRRELMVEEKLNRLEQRQHQHTVKDYSHITKQLVENKLAQYPSVKSRTFACPNKILCEPGTSAIPRYSPLRQLQNENTCRNEQEKLLPKRTNNYRPTPDQMGNNDLKLIGTQGQGRPLQVHSSLLHTNKTHTRKSSNTNKLIELR